MEIFKENVTSVSSSNTILSFKDCPNKCIDGYYVDPYKHKRVLCQYCSDKRVQSVKNNLMDNTLNQTLKESLNLPDSFTGINFDIDTVIPKFAVKDITEESLTKVKRVLTDLVNKASIGDIPVHSYLFNLGKKVYENNFIYAYLTRAYMSGVTVSPLVTALDLCSLRNNEEKGLSNNDNSPKYSDYLKTDVCIVTIDTGATFFSINAVKGLMQLRANRGKSTIIFTNIWNSQIFDLCSEKDEFSKNLAELVSIEYTEAYLKREEKYLDKGSISNKINSSSSLSTAEFNNLLSSRKNL